MDYNNLIVLGKRDIYGSSSAVLVGAQCVLAVWRIWD